MRTKEGSKFSLDFFVCDVKDSPLTKAAESFRDIPVVH